MKINRRIKVVLNETDYEAVAWVHLAKDRDMWWCLENTVMSLGFLERQEIP
jgi:hypothetical protein